MRSSILLSLAGLAATMLLALPARAGNDADGRYQIDPAHSNITFSLSHLGISRFSGRFDNVSGEFVAAGKDSHVHAEIALDGLNTGHAKREAHLKSGDFFDAARFPVIVFDSTAMDLNARGDGSLTGTLTLHGVSRPVTLKVHHVGAGKDPWGGFRSGYLATATIKRSDWEMTSLLGPVGDEVDLSIGIEGIRQ